MNMKKIATVIAVLAFVTTVAFAQSSGNFSYGTSPQSDVACSIDKNGVMSGTETCEESCTIDSSGNSTLHRCQRDL
jgi:type 1 fimbria pilin